MVSKIRFKNFKLFKDWQTLEIKPLTVLIGKNNTGKTAVLKLPILVNALLKGENVNDIYRIKIDTEDNLIELGSSFSDLVYNRSTVSGLELEISNDSKEVKVLINPVGLLGPASLFTLNDNGTALDTEYSNDKFNLSAETTDSLSFNVDYIGGIRVEPENIYYNTRTSLKKIGTKGQNTYPVLIQDFKKSKQLLNKISNWYDKNFEGWKIDVIENKLSTETNYSVVISTEKIDSINLKQSGQGIHQVLPLITRSFMPELSPSIIIIEEPEAHLHPAAHANLAERFVDSYLEDRNKRYLIETHSLNFILRIRRLIAEGKLNAEDLNIYYVDYDEDSNVSKLQEIKVDAGGGVDRWPDGVFGESVLEARAIMNANINDLRNVD